MCRRRSPQRLPTPDERRCMQMLLPSVAAVLKTLFSGRTPCRFQLRSCACRNGNKRDRNPTVKRVPYQGIDELARELANPSVHAKSPVAIPDGPVPVRNRVEEIACESDPPRETPSRSN